MLNFATYLHANTLLTSRPSHEIEFVGQSYPYLSQVRAELEIKLSQYSALPVRQAEYSDYLAVHSESYLQQLVTKASGQVVEHPPKLSIEC
jgi:hypothetical protein